MMFEFFFHFFIVLTCDGDGKMDEIESIEIDDGCNGNALDTVCEEYACELG